jgi:hypothetical protein
MQGSDESMIYIVNFKKFSYYSNMYFSSKAKKCCQKMLSLLSPMLYGHFGINSNSVDSDEAMKRGDVALNALLLQYFRSVKRFIVSLL